MIFDGKAFAREIEEQVFYKVRNLAKKPRLASVLVGDDPASALYTRLKQAAAERVGIQFDVVKLDAGIGSQELGIRIGEIGSQADITGLMVQLPVAGLQGQALKGVLSAIPLDKDVDGLLWERSGVKPAVVRAVLSIVERIAKGMERFVVLGSGGAVGRPLVLSLRERGVRVDEIERDTPEPVRRLLEGQVIISCVGKAGLVTADMVRDDLIAIDVGMSQVDGKVVGDMTQAVYQKASIAVTVPGGVGPVTIASLLANAAELYAERITPPKRSKRHRPNLGQTPS